MTRVRAEAALAIVFTAGLILGGGAALYVAFTMSVHPDAAAVPSATAGAPGARDAAAVQEASRLARAVTVKENLPALSVAVARADGVVWAEALGWANVERRVPATPLTRFRIGGVSIPLTSAAVGVLYERGRLDLDAPVQRYVPAFPAKPWPVSTREVMGHLAGIQHNGMPAHRCTSLADALPIFSSDPLVYRPGTERRFSIYDWILVSAVIEAAAGEPYLAFMNREVLSRAGMERTVPDGDDVPDRVSFYFPRAAQQTALGLQDAPRADYSCFAGSGAFLSTPTDLARFGAAMLKPGLLTRETIDILQTPAWFEAGNSIAYALGWNVEHVQLGGAPARLLGHKGSSMGGTTSLLTFPDLDLAVAVASNVSYASGVDPLGRQIAEAFVKSAAEWVR